MDERFKPVHDAFAEIMATQHGTGGGLAAWCDDRRVIDLWGGYVDADRQRLWGPDSLVQPYSVCKPLAAVCLLQLVDVGRVDLDARVQSYWPEFTAPATVRHLLSHQAGVVAIDGPVLTETIYQWDEVCRLLARQEPAWIPGQAHGESALFYGHLVGELVRRVDGRSLGRFLRDEICRPLELDFAVGLDASQRARAVTLTGLDDAFRSSTLSGHPRLYARIVTNPPGALDPHVVNGAAWRAAAIPAVNGHGTARALADFYHALATGQLLSAGMLADAVTAQCSGPDLVLGQHVAWGLGFGVGNDGYGMGGLGGSYAGTSTAGGYSLAFVTGTVGTHQRAIALENAFRDCLGLTPLAHDS